MKAAKIIAVSFLIILPLLAVDRGPWTVDYCAADEPITLTIWELSANERLMRHILNEFEKENPAIHVNLQQLTWEYGLEKFIISLSAGNAPDICELGTTWIAKLASAGVLRDITGEVADIKEKYFLWDSAAYDGKTYGVPWLAGTRILFYNKDLFAGAGLDPNSPPQTWTDLLLASKKIHSPEKGVWGFSIFAGEPESPWHEFMPFVWSNGGRILSRDLKKSELYSDETLQALEFYKELSGHALIERQAQVNELFAEGKVGMQISGSWNLRLIPALNPQLNYGVAMVPRGDNKTAKGVAFVGGELFVITKASKHPEEAMKLIKFLTNKKNVMEIVRIQQNVVPARRGVIDNPYYYQFPEQKMFLTQLEAAEGPPNHPRWTEMQEEITRLVEKTIMKDEPPREALLEASLNIDRIICEETVGKKTGDVLITLIAIFIFSIIGAGIYIYSKINRRAKPRRPVNKRAGSWKPYLYLSPWLITFILFGAYPLIYSLIISFSKYDILTSQLYLVGFKNYIAAFSDKAFLRALWHTFVFSVGTVPPTIGLALFCAVLINRRIPFKRLYQAGIFLPVMISVVVISTVFTYIYSPAGLANAILDFFGILHPPSSWLNNPKSWLDISIPLLSIMAMNVWASFGYYTILFLAGLQTIPDNLYEMASMDGATEWQKFKHITFPQLKPIILLGIIINTIYSLQVFPEVFTMTMGGPLGSTTTAVYHLYDLGFHKFDMGAASSVAYILSIIIMLFSVLQMKILKPREETKE